MIYKVMSKSDFDSVKKQERYAGSAHDVRDGFIHFSTREQLSGTLAKHYAEQADLVLLGVALETVETQLRWEASRNDELFPHVYGEMKPSDFQFMGNIAWDGKVHSLPTTS